jgi:glucose-6-phosphate isomerase, archaeal
MMKFHPGLELRIPDHELSFRYGAGVFGPIPEMRLLDEIRPSLRDPGCDGPDPVYGIAMDVCREEHHEDLRKRMLLLGAVVFASGKLGEEPVRSQGHIHTAAPHSGWSPPELCEIWEGSAIIYAQETADDQPGRCFAISASVGDQVVVPPGWAHCVINADPSRRMAFGAWCDREYGFDYRGVRAHGGLAWFPRLPQEGKSSQIQWVRNPTYLASELTVKTPSPYPALGLDSSVSIYNQFVKNPNAIQWVSEPARVAGVWANFIP